MKRQQQSLVLDVRRKLLK